MQCFEFHFAQDRVHHDEQTYGYGNGDADEFAFLESGAGVGDEIAEEDAYGHCEEDPEGEEAVEEAEGFEGGDFGCVWLGMLFGVGGRGDGEFRVRAGKDRDGMGGGVVLHLGGLGGLWGLLEDLCRVKDCLGRYVLRSHD